MITDTDTDVDELIAVAGGTGFAAPADRRANQITVDGRTLRYVDSEAIVSNPATAPPFASINGIVGALINVTGYGGSPIVAGVAFGTPASGYRPDTSLAFAGTGAYILVDSANVPRYPPVAGTDGLLTTNEVTQTLKSGLSVAGRARAQIRRPLGSAAQVSVVVVDTKGVVLGLVRTPDAPVFGTDVAVQKARTAAFFSSATAAAQLNALPPANYPTPPATSSIGAYVTATRAFLGDPTAFANGVAYSNRAIGNLARPYFPDGIAGTANGPLAKPLPPWSAFNDGLQLDLVFNNLVAGVGGDPVVGCTGAATLPNGIQIFAGSVPDLPRRPAGRRGRRLGRRHRPGRHGRVPRARQCRQRARHRDRQRADRKARGQHRSAGHRHAAALRELSAIAVQRQHRAECLRGSLSGSRLPSPRPVPRRLHARQSSPRRSRRRRRSTGASAKNAPAQPPLSEDGRYGLQVLAAALDVHAAPEPTSQVIAQEQQGAQLQAVERKGPWFRIELVDGRAGWIHYVVGKAGPNFSVDAAPGLARALPGAAPDGGRAGTGRAATAAPKPAETASGRPHRPAAADGAAARAADPRDRSGAGAAARAAAAARNGAGARPLAARRRARRRPPALVRSVPPERAEGRPSGLRRRLVRQRRRDFRHARTRHAASRPPVGAQSTLDPGSNDQFGRGKQSQFVENLILSLALIKGDTTFRPPDFELRVVPVINFNRTDVGEVRVTNVDPRTGTTRNDSIVALQEAFVDFHLRNVSDNYDFDSIRVGIQPFISDFRGLLYVDEPIGVRLFGNRDSNRWQYNLAWFRRIEKDTNSGLNDIGKPLRDEDILVANLYRQDFPVPGFTLQGTVIYDDNRENDEEYYDNNGFLTRPAALGDEQPHTYKVTYLGVNGDGHFGRWNLTASGYYVFGSVNQIRSRSRRSTSARSMPSARCRAISTGSACAARASSRAATRIPSTTRPTASTRSSRIRRSPAPTRATGSGRRCR